MGGVHVSGRGPGDDGYDEDGYDESQRAEILEATRDGRSNGTIVTDLSPDLGEDPDEVDEDAISMRSDEIGQEALAEDEDADDQNEDALQADFDDDAVAEDAIDDGDAVTLAP